MRKVLLILLIAIAPNLFSQESETQNVKIVNHQVMMGETIRMISKKYLVPPADIYKLNKSAVDGITAGQILRIPVPIKDEPVAERQEEKAEAQAVAETHKTAPDYQGQTTEHQVKSGETLSALAQKYGVTVQAIKDANPKVAKSGLRSGERIAIPPAMPSDDFVNQIVAAVPGKSEAPKSEAKTVSASETPHEAAKPAAESASAEAPNQSGVIEHKVLSGETLFGLARKYNVTVDVIKKQNPKVAHGLQVGQVITIKPE